METMYVYCGCCIALACGVRNGERRPQLEFHTRSVQVTCLMVVEDSVRASGSRSEITGVVVRIGSKGEGIGIKDGWSEPPMVRLAKARVVVFVRVLIAVLPEVGGNTSRLLVD